MREKGATRATAMERNQDFPAETGPWSHANEISSERPSGRGERGGGCGEEAGPGRRDRHPRDDGGEAEREPGRGRMQEILRRNEELEGRLRDLARRPEAALAELEEREKRLGESEERFRITFEKAAVGMAHVAPAAGGSGSTGSSRRR